MPHIVAYHSSTPSPKGGRLSGRQKVLYVLGLGLMVMMIGDGDGVFNEDDERYGIDGERDDKH